MNIPEKLLKYARKPPLYEKGTAVMWTDPHISKQLLDIHLNPDLDLASRKHSTINTTAIWILAQLPTKPARILDLGCGPGLYTEQFARVGNEVTGIDFSENSINYARKQAAKSQLNIEYFRQNYLELALEEKSYDLVTMIYTDFGVLLPEERSILLKNVKKALKPGGIFIFDVLSDQEIEKKVTPGSWELRVRGFWRNQPYLALSESFFYEKEKVILSQHLLVDENDQLDVYRFWTHYFSNTDVAEILESNEFEPISFNNTIIPEGGLWSGEHVTFCIASS